MRQPSLYLTAAGGVVRRDLALYLSYRFRPVTQMINVFLSLALFFYISRLVDPARVGTDGTYFAYAIVGIAGLQLVTASLSTVPGAVRGELLTGTFERLILSPFGIVGSVVCTAIFPALLATATATATMLLGGLVFGLDLRWSTAALAVPVAMLASFAFAPFAIAAVSLLLVAKRAGASTAYLTTLLSLTSGAFFPPALLPWWVEWVSAVQPLTPALQLLRRVLVGGDMEGSPLGEAARLAAFGVVLLPVGIYLLKTAIRFGQRRGTLTEY